MEAPKKQIPISYSVREKRLLFIDQIPGVAVRVMRDPDGKIETRESRLFAGYYEKN